MMLCFMANSLTLCMLGNLHAGLSSAIFILFFLKKKDFKYFFHEFHQFVKKFESRSGPTFSSGLIWVQTVCKGYRQTTK